MRTTGVGKTLTALRPKNIKKFIMEGGVDKVLKGGVNNIKNQNIIKNITESDVGKRIKQRGTDLIQ